MSFPSMKGTKRPGYLIPSHTQSSFDKRRSDTLLFRSTEKEAEVDGRGGIASQRNSSKYPNSSGSSKTKESDATNSNANFGTGLSVPDIEHGNHGLLSIPQHLFIRVHDKSPSNTTMMPNRHTTNSPTKTSSSDHNNINRQRSKHRRLSFTDKSLSQYFRDVVNHPSMISDRKRLLMAFLLTIFLVSLVNILNSHSNIMQLQINEYEQNYKSNYDGNALDLSDNQNHNIHTETDQDFIDHQQPLNGGYQLGNGDVVSELPSMYSPHSSNGGGYQLENGDIVSNLPQSIQPGTTDPQLDMTSMQQQQDGEVEQSQSTLQESNTNQQQQLIDSSIQSNPQIDTNQYYGQQETQEQQQQQMDQSQNQQQQQPHNDNEYYLQQQQQQQQQQQVDQPQPNPIDPYFQYYGGFLQAPIESITMFDPQTSITDSYSPQTSFTQLQQRPNTNANNNNLNIHFLTTLPKIESDGSILLRELANFKDVTEPHSNSKMDDVPIFLHIPKAGGSTIKDIMGTCHRFIMATEKGILDGHNEDMDIAVVYPGGGPAGQDRSPFVNVDTTTIPGIVRAIEMGFANAGLADAVVTPFIYEANELFTPTAKGRLFTVFRHPIERAVSMFYYLQIATWEPTYDPELKFWSIEQYAESSKIENNWLTRQLSNANNSQKPDEEISDVHLQIAKEVIRRKFVVGLMTQMEKTMDRFEKFFHWKYRVMPTNQEKCRETLLSRGANANSDNTSSNRATVEPGTRTWDLFKVQNEYDLQLYDYIVHLFDEQEKLVAGMPDNFRNDGATCCKCGPPTYPPEGGFTCPLSILN